MLDRHRSELGDVDRQIVLWSELIRSAPDDATKERVLRLRAQALTHAGNERALLEAKLELMGFLIDKDQRSAEAIELGRLLLPGVMDRIARDNAKRGKDQSCTWLEREYSASIAKVLAGRTTRSHLRSYA